MNMMNYIYKITFLSCLLSFNPIYSLSISAQKNHKNFFIGLDIANDEFTSQRFFGSSAMDSLQLDFVIYHYKPKGTLDEEIEKLNKLENDFNKKNTKIILNLEVGNWNLDLKSKDGFEYVAQPNGLHVFKFSPKVLSNINKSNGIWGIQYDEIEHCQINRNLSITIDHRDKELPGFAETTGMTFKEADNAIYKEAKSLVDTYKSYGFKYVIGEHVWPVLFNNFARAGITPVYKQMKENWSNVMGACAVGASLQYNQELWSCLDFWYYNTYPGHTSQELWANLLFAYWFGVDKAYIESIASFSDDGTMNFNDNGKTFMRFINEYVPNHPRSYTFRDYKPEIAIVRFDDTEWGQGSNCYLYAVLDGQNITYNWTDRLFGAYNLKTSPASEEWLKAWNTITHNEVDKRSLSWGASNIYGDRPYKCFAPMNSVAVFDNTVSKKHLDSTKLIFLCGLFISDSTLNDIKSLLQEKNLSVVSSNRFAPKELVDKYSGGTKSFKYGKGHWIITDDMASKKVKDAVKPFLGNDNEIVLKFKGNKTVSFEISKDGKSFKQVKLPVSK